MNAQFLKCGCIFDGKEFTKYCREHGLKLLRTRWEKELAKTSPESMAGEESRG